MKLPLDSVLTNIDDSPAVDEKGDSITLRKVLIRAALSEMDGDMQPVKGEAKLERYDLYRKVKKANAETDFTPEQVVALRKAVLIYPPLTCGQIHDLLA